MKLKFLFLLFIFITPLLHASDISHDRVAQINFVVKRAAPTEKLDEAALKARMKTKEGGVFSQFEFDNDLKELSLEFDRVEPQLEWVNNQVFITLNIWFKPVIREIYWNGNHDIKTRRLRKELGISSGTVFDRFAFNEAFQKVRAYYVKKGYFEAQLDYQIQFLEEFNEVNISICIDEGRAGKIKNIYFENFTKEEEKELLQRLHTKEYNLFTSWFTQSGTLQEEIVEQDKITIIGFLQDQGYADAKVDISITPSQEEGRVDVTITAEKGELYTFGCISFSGNTVFTDEQIWRQFKVWEGMVFSPSKLRQTVQALSTLYGAFGYIDAVVSFQPSLDSVSPVYNVSFSIREGSQYRVGLIKVFGNTSTNTRVILHECLMIPGQVFDTRKLQATEERLYNINYFKNVNVYPVKTQETELLGENYRDIHIEVEETGTGNISAFFGFSTLDSLFGGVELLERNFNYKGLWRMFSDGPQALRGEGEYLQLKAMFGTKTSDYLLRWVKPYFQDTNWVVGFDLEKGTNKTISKIYNVDTSGVRLHATYPINVFVNFGWHYRFRWTSNKLTNSSKATAEEIAQATRGGIISGSGFNLTYNRIDNSIRPRDGFRSDLGIEYNGLGGEYKYTHLSYINTYYIPVGEKGTLKFRADARFIQMMPGSKRATYNNGTATLSREESLPISEHLFLGGETTVRGYRSFSIGPQGDANSPQGGLTSFLVSEEYLQPLFKKVDGFVFVDGGSVCSLPYHINKIRVSAGYGLRVELFNNIPIIFGMGYPLNPKYKTDVRRFFISLGGRF